MSARRRKVAAVQSQEREVVTIKESKPPQPSTVFCIGCAFFVSLAVFVLLSSSLVSFALMDSYTWGYQTEDIKKFPIVSLFFPPVT